MRDPIRQRLEAELQRWADVTAVFSHRRKHRQVTLEVAGRKRFLVYPCTPSEYRGLRNTIAQLRGVLRALGAKLK